MGPHTWPCWQLEVTMDSLSLSLSPRFIDARCFIWWMIMILSGPSALTSLGQQSWH